eukprot:TRINITY_DN8322_c0_g1_i1.p1 TRINITY_DN8322_c0_g1~~TRINITY_DN8322_c0_g1_i1.p1  ORF type:complete len:230 (-),score=26.79 TRINITY_DN8322_c0_g1_i1:415-1104(-)
MGGEVSNLAHNMSDDEILEFTTANSFKNINNKTTVVSNFRKAASQADNAKERYGNGVSAKFILTNISGRHYLQVYNYSVVSGKDWHDSEVRKPSQEIGPLDSTGFFHAKRNSTMCATSGGIQFSIIDANGYQQGYVAIAWCNPYAGGTFRIYVKLSQNPINLNKVNEDAYDYSNSNDYLVAHLDRCDDQTGKYNRFVQAFTKTDDSSTAYGIIAIKVDDIVRAIIEGEL